MKLNKEYKEITGDILNNENFMLLKNDNHHGTNRYDHCKRVAYLSYLFAKIFKGNTEEATMGGLLHDFFYGKTESSEETSYINHPMTSAINAKKYFNITDEEAKIIETHMYHYALVKNIVPFINKKEKVSAKEFKPTSKEGVIVCLSDLLVSIFEVSFFKVRYSASLYALFLINLFRY